MAFEPRIVGFFCHYCALAAQDVAGKARINFPTNVREVRVLCTGKVDLLYILKALEKGADGVLIIGCQMGDCYFRTGNEMASKRVRHAKRILESIGFEKERVEMYEVPGPMGKRFAEIVTEMVEKIRALGPSPMRRGIDDISTEPENLPALRGGEHPDHMVA
jgi:F420-non-reducing hydrogenase iron-sulfur subunit